ncbi:unnamed protein product [Knipowitschia caucasica]
MFPIDASPVLGRDPAFMESISKTMRVPERLSVGPGPDQDQDQHQTKPPVYSMQVPDRLTYAEAAELSPRPQFGPKSRLEVCVESPQEIHRDQQQSPIRRSMSDQCFARTPPGTPPGTPHRAMVLPRPQGTSRRLVDLPPVSPSTSSLPPPSAHSLLQMTLQASARLLQAASRKYRCLGTEPPQTPLRAETVPVQSDSRRTESWVAEDEGGAAVELIVLRRQVLKMSRRLAALERHNCERQNTELVLFCLLGSACLLNAWLWIRR